VHRQSIAVAALSALSVSAHAQKIGVDFDLVKTRISWILSGSIHTVHGTFRLKQGHVEFDAANGTIGGDLVADAASGESGNASRDKRMRKDIIESDSFPEIRLAPKQITGSMSLNGRSTVQVSGTFSLHGGTHNVTIPMDVAFSEGNLTGTGKFSIPYVDWGMKNPSNFLFKVDKSVEVEILAIGRVTSK
jgi:polyisoprenoid-binding protein YceI